MAKLIKKPYEVMKGQQKAITKVVDSAAELNNLVSALKVTKKMMDKQVPSEILNAIELVGQIQALEKQLGDAKDALKQSVRSIMETTKTDEIVSGEFKAIYSEYTSDTFDKTAFKKDHKKMYENYLKTQNKTRFEINGAKK